MANNTTKNPWVLDTPGIITRDAVSISGVQWYPNAVDDDLVIAHADGSEVYSVRAIASAANNESVGQEPFYFKRPVSFEGFMLKTMDSGRLLVFKNSMF